LNFDFKKSNTINFFICEGVRTSYRLLLMLFKTVRLFEMLLWGIFLVNG
jgi:hypothetical protein